MRTIRLGRQFDAVFVHDAIDYMTTKPTSGGDGDGIRPLPDRRAGRLVPDHIRETFEAGADHGGNDAADGRGVRYLEWNLDPDPDDTWTTTEYAFLLRDADGSVRVVHETHRTGLFSKAPGSDS